MTNATNNTTNNAKAHVQMPKTFSQEEFDARLEKAKSEYLEGKYEHNRWVYPAAVIKSVPTLQMLLELVIQKDKEGQSLYPYGDEAEGMVGYYRVMLWKPKAEIDADIAALKTKVEEEYKFEIESFNAAQLELLTQQLLAQEQAKERKKQEDKEAKQLAQAKADAEAYFASLNKKEGK